MSLAFTPVESIAKIVQETRDAFASHKTLPAAFRKHQLRQLVKMMNERKNELQDAVYKDLHKHALETNLYEIVMTANEAIDAIEHLDQWMAPSAPPVDALNALDGCRVLKDPKGTVLIIGAWNYPVQLTLTPLAGAIAAGCTAVIKPSEVSPHTAELLAKLVPEYLDPTCYRVVNGAVAETSKLLEQKWDHIFYTGNGSVARIIMTAAAKQLCPVTLELGGKSPTIVDETCDLATVARRIAWGKFVNCGQTCIAPDYIIAVGDVERKLIEPVKAALMEFFGENPKTSQDYGRIVNGNHVQRLKPLLASGEAAIGGEVDENDKYIAPTVLTKVSVDAPVMKDEIFGPILPIITVRSYDEAIALINSRDKPLALYVFSNNKKAVERVSKETSSGAILINDTLMHAGVSALPFGGVGGSGMGAYHGKRSFDVFTHEKAAMFKDQGLEFVNAVRYPPYTKQKESLLSFLLGKKIDGVHVPVKQIVTVIVIALAVARAYSTPAFMTGLAAFFGF